MNEYLLLTIWIIAIIVEIVASQLYKKDIINGAITVVIITLVGIAMLGSLSQYNLKQHEKRLEALQTKTDAYWNDIDTKAETYKIMLDGKEVSKDDVDIHMYKISVNNEKQTIFITN